jgi:UDP-N-acetylglucosamine diphosphorylase/glucosamine-1-phosphate N-acetyltransferase
MRYCIFEDASFGNFLPLAYTRPVFELRSGVGSLREGIERLLPKGNAGLLCRPYLAGCLAEELPGRPVNDLTSDDTWFINGRALPGDDLAKVLRAKSPAERVYVSGGGIAAAFVKGPRAGKAAEALAHASSSSKSLAGFDAAEIGCTLVTFPWDLVDNIAPEIDRAYGILSGSGRGRVSSLKSLAIHGVHLINARRIVAGRNPSIQPGVVLDARHGPIVLGSNVTLMANSVIEGPAYIGDNAVVKIGARIYHGTAVGPHSKIGGEVEASVVQSCSNKQHDGFLGHSFLGSWVNLGAGTNVSDLKNTYGPVSVPVNGAIVNSGRQFVGLTMGDHSKTGINSMFDTGSVVGVSCNLFGAGLPPKAVPSFSWGGKDRLTVYEPEKSLEAGRRVMARRNVAMSGAYEQMMREVFRLSEEDRRRGGAK